MQKVFRDNFGRNQNCNLLSNYFQSANVPASYGKGIYLAQSPTVLRDMRVYERLDS